MILIEMHMSNPGGRSQYVWMEGGAWPVPESEEFYINRIEAFGAELGAIRRLVDALPPGRTIWEGATQELIDWGRIDAQYISGQLRIKTGRTP